MAAQTIAALGVTKTQSMIHISNGNEYRIAKVRFFISSLCMQYAPDMI